LENSLNKISSKQVPCIVVGDMNIDLIKWNVHRPTSEYLDILLNNNFQPIMVIPTRITTKSSTLIDHINFFEGNYRQRGTVHCGNILSDISDHLPNYLMLVPDCSKPKQTQPMIRLFTDKAKMQFRNRLLDVDWNKVCEEADINEARANDKKIDNSSSNTKHSCRSETRSLCFEQSKHVKKIHRDIFL
jgi:hypothetical protein